MDIIYIILEGSELNPNDLVNHSLFSFCHAVGDEVLCRRDAVGWPPREKTQTGTRKQKPSRRIRKLLEKEAYKWKARTISWAAEKNSLATLSKSIMHGGPANIECAVESRYRFFHPMAGTMRAQTSWRCTPVYKAAPYGSNEVLVRLIELGAQLDSYVQYKSAVDLPANLVVCKTKDLAEHTHQHLSALHVAAYANMGSVIARLLKDFGMETHACVYDVGYTPLRTATYTKYPDPATLAQPLAAGASVDQLSYTGCTALLILSTAGDHDLQLARHAIGAQEQRLYIKCMSVLLRGGADINRQGIMATPLSNATGSYALDIMRFLLDNGAQVDPVTEPNINVIHTLPYLLSQWHRWSPPD